MDVNATAEMLHLALSLCKKMQSMDLIVLFRITLQGEVFLIQERIKDSLFN